MLLAYAWMVAQGANEALARELYRAQMAAAQAAIRLDELAEARIWLDRTAPTLRGFEWRVHDAALDESLASVVVAASAGAAHASMVAASPIGDVLAVGKSEGAIELRRADDGSLVAELGRHEESLSYLRFDSSGKRVVSASFDRSVKVWDVDARKLLVDFTKHGYPVGGAVFSPNGELVASCSYERDAARGVWGVVHVWNSETGELVRTLEGGRKPLVGLAFSPDGARLAAGSWDFCVFVWEVAGGEPRKCDVPDEGLYNAVDDVLWTADGEHVVGASKDKTARVWNASTTALVATLRGHTDAVDKLALSPDGAQLATASADGVLKLWSTADWSAKATLRGHADDVVSCCFSTDGSRLFSSSKDLTLRTWSSDVSQYGGAKFTTAHAPYVVRFSPDDSRLAVASYDGRIEVRDANTLEVVKAWGAHPENKSCHALGWTPDGKRLVSGSWEPIVRVWDTGSGAELAKFEQEAGTYDLATSPDGKSAATCAGKSVVVWSLESFEKRLEFKGHASTVLAVNYSPDAARCVSSARDGKAIVWDATSGSVVFEVPCDNADVAEALFTPDGRQLAVAGRDGALTLHDADSGALVRELATLRHGVQHIDISPDGKRLAAAANVVVLLDLEFGGVVGELRPHREPPYNLDFDARGERLVSCSTDKTVVVSDTRSLRARLASR
jgi:WD40 repeat protein